MKTTADQWKAGADKKKDETVLPSLLRFGILQRIKLTVCIIWCIALVRQMLTENTL